MQKPKGTYDVYGEYGEKVLYIESLLKDLMSVYNYEYLRTPIFEVSELYKRGVGETTDIVTKETYDFLDRGDRSMTLRPEGTAGVVRSYVENKMYGDSTQPKKCWYYGPMFRYERPQSGRFREFYQFGVEVFGTNDPMIDAEVISIPVNLYKMLGLKGIRVSINSLGDKESRENYRNALIEYFKPYIGELCEDCQSRYQKNPLRILDCKVDAESKAIKNAPKITDYLNEESKKHFLDVQKYLKSFDVDFVVDSSIVRGLDYYTNTVFEVSAEVKGFGAQNVLCGGGRYNNLVENIGSVSSPGVGFALGMERLITALDYENINLIDDDKLDIYIIPMSDDEKEYALNLVQNLRMYGYKTDIDYMNRNIKSNFKQADRFNSKYIIIIGSEEVKNNLLTIKNNKTKTEEKIALNKVYDYLDDEFNSGCNCGCEECKHE